jgi:hypothetical protein
MTNRTYWLIHPRRFQNEYNIGIVPAWPSWPSAPAAGPVIRSPTRTSHTSIFVGAYPAFVVRHTFG